jgi:hypothetical protein
MLRYVTIFLLLFFMHDPFVLGQKSYRIAYAPEPPVIDGLLSPGEWNTDGPATGFTQMEPEKGQPATEPTEVYICEDSLFLYIAFLCGQGGKNHITANIQTRDAVITGDDAVIVLLDTYMDGRSAYGFSVNPLGTQTDYKITDDGGNINYEWDTEWKAAAGRTDGSWTCEIAIPFRSLKFRSGGDEWGLNLGRRMVSNNEISWWSG